MSNYHKTPNKYVTNVTLKVSDLEKSLAYYEQLFGFEVLERQTFRANLALDGKTNLLTLEQPENVTPKKEWETGIYHFALLVPTRADLADFIVHAAEINIKMGSADHFVSEALYLIDPDGNEIEVYSDRKEDEWEWLNGEAITGVASLDFPSILEERTFKQWEGLPADTVMGHVHLYVSNLEQSHTFYTTGLGYEVVGRFKDQALFVSTGKYHHHIAFNTWKGAGAPPASENSVGLKTFSIHIPNQVEQDQMIVNLKSIGASVTLLDGVYHVTDPSGNTIILER